MSLSSILHETLNLKMAPKRGFYPLVLIVSLLALFIFSLHRYSSLPLPSSPPMTQFPLTNTNLNILQNPNLQTSSNFSLTIKVLTYDRLPSLTRCLRSLAAAHYDNEKVNIHVFVDHFKVLDQNDEYLDQKLNESRQILDFVDGFKWKFGEKMVHYRTGNVGLQAQWLEAWWPASDDEFAFVVEDDIELSPLYYKFLRGLIVNYYYNSSNYSPWIYGASLQRPRFVPDMDHQALVLRLFKENVNNQRKRSKREQLRFKIEHHRHLFYVSYLIYKWAKKSIHFEHAIAFLSRRDDVNYTSATSQRINHKTPYNYLLFTSRKDFSKRERLQFERWTINFLLPSPIKFLALSKLEDSH